MAEALRDSNFKTVATGVSSSDSVTPIDFKVDPSTNYLLVDIVVGAEVATPATQDKRDENFVPTVYGVSSVDGETLVPIRTDDNGNILLDITY
jgi:hypothetical protein